MQCSPSARPAARDLGVWTAKAARDLLGALGAALWDDEAHADLTELASVPAQQAYGFDEAPAG